MLHSKQQHNKNFFKHNNERKKTFVREKQTILKANAFVSESFDNSFRV